MDAEFAGLLILSSRRIQLPFVFEVNTERERECECVSLSVRTWTSKACAKRWLCEQWLAETSLRAVGQSLIIEASQFNWNSTHAPSHPWPFARASRAAQPACGRNGLNELHCAHTHKRTTCIAPVGTFSCLKCAAQKASMPCSFAVTTCADTNCKGLMSLLAC